MSTLSASSPSPSSSIVVQGSHLMAGLLGHRDSHLRLIESAFSDSEIIVRGNEISILGDSAGLVSRLFEELVLLLRRGEVVDDTVVKRCISMVRADEKPSSVLTDEILRGAKGRTIRPKTAGQKRYIDAIRKNVITFGVGPAGTGKTLLAVQMGIKLYQEGKVDRLIVTRPAVSVDEDLGFLPGTLNEKMAPWTRPIFDVLGEYYLTKEIESMLEEGIIEIAPLSYMRGRTFKNAYIIADEMQNATPNQMKMLLTRLGEGSKMVVTGDLNQADRLDDNGLIDFIRHINEHKSLVHRSATI